MINFLKSIKVIQERKRRNFNKVYYTEIRYNPYNPLSYIFMILELIGGFLIYGVIGIKSDLKRINYNPFKWF